MNQEGKWTPLHMHWESSYLDGVLRFKDIGKLKDKGINCTSCTDHGNLSGTYEFYKEAKKAGVKPIIGMEAYWAIDRESKAPDELRDSRPNYHMILLAKNKNGFSTLSKLSSAAYLTGFYYSPRIDNKLLEQYHDDLVATSACLSSISSQYILRNELDKAESVLRYYDEMLGRNNFFLELQVHNSDEQRIVNKQLLEFSKKLSIPIIITSDSHYMDCCDKQLHDKFLAIATKSKLSDPKRFSFKDLECHVPTYDEILQRCIDNNIPEEALANTNYIGDSIISNYFENIVNQWPKFRKVPPNMTAYEYLCELVNIKWYNKFGRDPTEEELARVNEELTSLNFMDCVDYMLILWDIMEYSNKNKILHGPGRGSSAGSLVAYILDITQINPLKYGLLYSRFMNEGRASTPVIF